MNTICRNITERADAMYKNVDDITLLEDFLRDNDSLGGAFPETIEAMKQRNLLQVGDRTSDIEKRLHQLKKLA